jgi:hypothetical protein
MRGSYTYISRRATLCSENSDAGIKRLRQLVHIQRRASPLFTWSPWSKQPTRSKACPA